MGVKAHACEENSINFALACLSLAVAFLLLYCFSALASPRESSSTAHALAMATDSCDFAPLFPLSTVCAQRDGTCAPHLLERGSHMYRIWKPQDVNHRLQLRA